ncbi:hypothetical protein FPQ18DRAFT_425484 [Pyronema domesticum]|uniref:Uncharacterized protein n=1 Tax=Pyronema omphalodes (strain CBS 100304) TaxID=1076935 RepID=U4KX82_PYROM|nr:hypothetical protein FPQ18DRAFT_425484 [Pyronema domesticum]CCX05911.1 Protein of unknown function [Pyronema omphalodes CBS 100304]
MKISTVTTILLSATPLIFALPTFLVKLLHIHLDIPLSLNLNPTKGSGLSLNAKISVGSGANGKNTTAGLHIGAGTNATLVGGNTWMNDTDNTMGTVGVGWNITLGGDVKLNNEVTLTLGGEAKLGGETRLEEEKSEKEKRELWEGPEGTDAE